jgi:hypothetical protein
MKNLLLMLGILLLATSPVLAGKNCQGAMVVHTDDAHDWTHGVCDNFDAWVPDPEWGYGTRTDKDEWTPALIWFIAMLPGPNPGVSAVYFGHDHNLPEYYHNHWGFCGPAGSIEVPDDGWPDSPSTAGNLVTFGSPILGDHVFPFYYLDVYGYSDVHYCTAINPVGGYAAFLDDSSPPVVDECNSFGCVRWYEEGYNGYAYFALGACCFDDGTCLMYSAEWCWLDGGEYVGGCIPCDPNPCPQQGACCLPSGYCLMRLPDDCLFMGGEYVGEGILCDPDPCSPTSSVPEISTETVTWGRIKTSYRRHRAWPRPCVHREEARP